MIESLRVFSLGIFFSFFTYILLSDSNLEGPALKPSA